MAVLWTALWATSCTSSTHHFYDVRAVTLDDGTGWISVGDGWASRGEEATRTFVALRFEDGRGFDWYLPIVMDEVDVGDEVRLDVTLGLYEGELEFQVASIVDGYAVLEFFGELQQPSGARLDVTGNVEIGVTPE